MHCTKHGTKGETEFREMVKRITDGAYIVFPDIKASTLTVGSSADLFFFTPINDKESLDMQNTVPLSHCGTVIGTELFEFSTISNV